MPRAERTVLIEELKKLLQVRDRYVDVAAQLRTWHRGADGEPVPGEILPRVYGGKYDRVARQYIGPPDPEHIVELSCHEGQLPLLLASQAGVAHVLALGAPGGGKTFAIIRRAILDALDHPNTTVGLVAPTGERRVIVWDELLNVLEPLGWIAEIRASKKQVELVTGNVFEVLSAKRASSAHSSPLAGRSWDRCYVDESQNVDDVSMREIDTRGRRVGTKYVVFESATNAPIPSFRLRKERYKAKPQLYQVVKYDLLANPWVEAEYVERLKNGLLSDRDYREQILVEDVPSDMLVYPQFSFADTVRPMPTRPRPLGPPRPTDRRDITARVVAEKFNRTGREFILAQDFGVLVTCTVVLKCYQGDEPGDRLWWAIDEITSGAGVTADMHARKVLQRYSAEKCLVIADPHFNSKETDKSDYHLFQREGLDIVPAVGGGGRIPKKHRISMVNTLLCDPNETRRFFVDCDRNGHPACKKLVESFLAMEYSENGDPEGMKKDYRDMSHWTAAAGYGLFPFERVRGLGTLSIMPGGLG